MKFSNLGTAYAFFKKQGHTVKESNRLAREAMGHSKRKSVANVAGKSKTPQIPIRKTPSGPATLAEAVQEFLKQGFSTTEAITEAGRKYPALINAWMAKAIALQSEDEPKKTSAVVDRQNWKPRSGPASR